MVKNDVGRGLTSLSFENVKLTQQTKLEGSVGDLFRSCTQLEELYIPQQLATAAGSLRSTGKSRYVVLVIFLFKSIIVINGILSQLFAVLRPLSAARSGSSSLLRVLDVSNRGGFGEERLTLSEISQLGEFETRELVLLYATF